MSKSERFSFLDAFLRTFYSNRWRGENVSTAEVEATVSNFLELQVRRQEFSSMLEFIPHMISWKLIYWSELQDACAYGVEIPGTEGRAGMIAILDPDNSLDLKKLYNGVSAKLPSYARPIFVRCVQQLDLTGDDAIIAHTEYF